MGSRTAVSLFETQFHELSDTLKIKWLIPNFRQLDPVSASSPCFKHPVVSDNEFRLEVTIVNTSCSPSEPDTLSLSMVSPSETPILNLYLHRNATRNEIGLKYLLGLGGPAGTMKMLTDEGVFAKDRVKFGGSLVQLWRVLHPNSSYLVDSTLVVFAEIRLLGPKETLTGQLEQYFQGRVFEMMKRVELTDLDVVAGGLELKAHRILVAASSPLFLSQLKQMQTEGLPLKLKLETDLSTVKIWLRLLYTGSLPPLSEEEALLSLRFGFNYQIPVLVNQIESHLKTCLSVTNVIRITRTAHQHNLSNLLDACVAFIKSHAKEVEDWTELFPDQQSRELFSLVFEIFSQRQAIQ